MIKHVIRGQEDPETTTIRWWLEDTGGIIKLVGSDGTKLKNVISINEEGYLYRDQDAELDGLKTDPDGRIQTREE